MTQRVRTDGPGFSAVGATWTRREIRCNGSQVTTSSGTTYAGGWSKTTTDVVTPNFRSRVKRGEIINNPYESILETRGGSATGEQVRTRVASCTGNTVKKYVETLYVNYGWDQYQPCVDGSGEWESLRNSAKIQAGTAAVAGIATTDVMGLVDIAELKKTLTMLRTPLENIREKFEQIKKSRKFAKSGLTFAKFLANEWTRYRYGIVPLMLTTESILEQLSNDKVSKRFTSRGYAMREFPEVVRSYNHTTTNFKSVSTGRYNGRIEVRAGVLYEYTFSTSAKFGLRLSDVPSAAYELVTLSFVLDWFANVGDFIAAISPRMGVRKLASWTKWIETREFDSDGTNVPVSSSTWSCTDNRVGTYYRHFVIKKRIPSVTVGLTWLPAFDFRNAENRSWLRTLDSVALTVQRLKFNF